MAKARKQNKDDAPNPNSVPNRDVMQRLNFLYQASVYLNAVSSPVENHPTTPTEQAPIASTSTSTEEEPRRSKRRTTSTADLSRSYVQAMKAIGRKTVVKMDPAVKRTLCKGCGTVLIPGSTSTVRIKPSSSHGHAVTYTCTKCKTSRRIPAPPVLQSEPGDHHSSLAGSESPKVVDNEMDVDHDAQNDIRSLKRRTRPAPRRQPLFQQPGHVLFRGNERIAGEDG